MQCLYRQKPYHTKVTNMMRITDALMTGFNNTVTFALSVSGVRAISMDGDSTLAVSKIDTETYHENTKDCTLISYHLNK